MPRGIYERNGNGNGNGKPHKVKGPPIWWEVEDDLTPYVPSRLKDEHKRKFALRILKEYIRWAERTRDEEKALDAAAAVLDDFGVTRAIVENDTKLWRNRWPAPAIAKMTHGGEAALIKALVLRADLLEERIAALETQFAQKGKGKK